MESPFLLLPAALCVNAFGVLPSSQPRGQCRTAQPPLRMPLPPSFACLLAGGERERIGSAPLFTAASQEF